MSSETDPQNDGVFVGSGGFTVDRRRAVRKLRSFQLPTTFGASLLFVRAAIAAKSSHIRIQQQNLWCEVRFDGDPFEYALLQDPYAPILGDGQSDAKGRFLAYGLIHSLEYRPSAVTVRTGLDENRYRLIVSPEDASSAREDLQKIDAEGETETSVQLEWSSRGKVHCRKSHLTKSSIKANCAMCSATIALGDTLVHDPEEDYPEGEMFQWDGATIVMDNTPVGSTGYLELFHHGVRVQRLEFPDQEKSFRAWVDDSELTLNASLTGVAQDQRFKRLLREIKKAA